MPTLAQLAHRAYQRTYYCKHKDKLKAKREARSRNLTLEQKIQRAKYQKAYSKAYYQDRIKSLKQKPQLACAEREMRNQSTLYIMTIREMPGIFKVGRTSNLSKRRDQLNAGHCFDLRVVSEYPDCGEFEKAIHNRLSPYRVKSQRGKSVEWFKTTIEHIHNTVFSVVNSSWASSSSIHAQTVSEDLYHLEE